MKLWIFNYFFYLALCNGYGEYFKIFFVFALGDAAEVIIKASHSTSIKQ